MKREETKATILIQGSYYSKSYDGTQQPVNNISQLYIPLKYWPCAPTDFLQARSDTRHIGQDENNSAAHATSARLRKVLKYNISISQTEWFAYLKQTYQIWYEI